MIWLVSSTEYFLFLSFLSRFLTLGFKIPTSAAKFCYNIVPGSDFCSSVVCSSRFYQVWKDVAIKMFFELLICLFVIHYSGGSKWRLFWMGLSRLTVLSMIRCCIARFIIAMIKKVAVLENLFCLFVFVIVSHYFLLNILKLGTFFLKDKVNRRFMKT